MNIFMFSHVKYASYEENWFSEDFTASIQLKGQQKLENQLYDSCTFCCTKLHYFVV
jgi:hypothetical protein